MRIPDWLVYSLVLLAVVATLFVRTGSDNAHAPIAVFSDAFPSPRKMPGPVLPGPRPLDEEVLVQVDDPSDGIGTAFAINRAGDWLTARHVVDGCTNVALAIGDGRYAPVENIVVSTQSDLALLKTDRAPEAMSLDLDRKLHVGDEAFHVGFPQGRSGEAASQLAARSRLVTRGRYRLDEPVLAWNETGRSDGLDGTLAGMSGGPVLDADGSVIGVTVAESPRHGRIYSAAPDSIRAFLEEQGLMTPGGAARPLALASYTREADRLRRELAVVKVVCRAGVRH